MFFHVEYNYNLGCGIEQGLVFRFVHFYFSILTPR